MALDSLLANTQMVKHEQLHAPLILRSTKDGHMLGSGGRMRRTCATQDEITQKKRDVSMISHLFGHLRQQQRLPSARSTVDHQRAHPAPIGGQKIIVDVIQGLSLELVERCVGFTQGQVLQDLVVQRVGLRVKVLLDGGLDDVHHVLVELFAQTLHVVALHFL